MRNVLAVMLAMLVFATINGCAFVNVDLVRPASPLQERVVEGKGQAKILLVDVAGMISEKEESGVLESKPSMVACVKEALQKAEQDKDVAGIILKINSPGGTVTASDIIYHEIRNFKAKRNIPIYACILGIGASGGYYVATAADEIIAHPTSITGSIGVMIMTFNVEGLMSKIGVSEHTIKSVDKKDILSPFRPASPEERQIMQTIIDRLHSRFVDVVQARNGNKLDRKQIEALADGRIYTADQALSDKLIDRIGYLDDAISLMKKQLNVEEAKVITYYRRGSNKDTIYSSTGLEAPQVFNLINVNADGLGLLAGTQFMYLWRQ